MGQKVNPHGLRVGVIKDWDSRWFADKKNFGATLVEDYNLRKTLKAQLYNFGIAKIEIERPSGSALCAAGRTDAGNDGDHGAETVGRCMTAWQRAEALISVAHPDFREQLIKDAEKMRLWRRSNKR